MNKEDNAQGVEVPFTMLPAEVLQRMLEEFVLREGTDYGHDDYTLESKVADVRGQLERRKIKIFFDEASETFDIVRSER